MMRPVIKTAVMDAQREARWDRAFREKAAEYPSNELANRRATIVQN